jgi:glutaminyl-peptide cyclotransferase
MHSLKKLIILLCVAFIFSRCGGNKESEKPTENNLTPETPLTPTLEYSITATWPHDTSSFTEGFLIQNNQLFESTGSPNGSNFKSVFGIVNVKTGKIDVKAELDKSTYFGEGIVILKNKIYQLTYQNQLGFIYDAKSYKKIGQFNYQNKEGWGMTTDGTYIIMSDGTENLTFMDADLKVVKALTVTENGYAQQALNELEYINGYIYANVWMTAYIVKIDPNTGNIVAKINLAPMDYNIKNLYPKALEMNGIAFDAINDKIYVTGKAWPFIYEVAFKH